MLLSGKGGGEQLICLRAYFVQISLRVEDWREQSACLEVVSKQLEVKARKS